MAIVSLSKKYQAETLNEVKARLIPDLRKQVVSKPSAVDTKKVVASVFAEAELIGGDTNRLNKAIRNVAAGFLPETAETFEEAAMFAYQIALRIPFMTEAQRGYVKAAALSWRGLNTQAALKQIAANDTAYRQLFPR